MLEGDERREFFRGMRPPDGGQGGPAGQGGADGQGGGRRNRGNQQG